MILKHPNPSHEQCSAKGCEARPAFACDYQLRATAHKGGWKPCARATCPDHTTFRGADHHTCPLHSKKAKKAEAT